MNLVDEQHVARLEIGQQRRQVARALQHRAGSTLDRHTHFLGDDVGQGGLAQPRRPEDQRMVEGFPAPLGGLDEQLHLLAHARLADIVGQAQRANGAVQLLITLAAGDSGNQAIGFDHLDHAFQ
ncbi:hypothetical protein D3C80_1704800 [compost metagenome]